MPPLPNTDEAFRRAVLERRDRMTEAERNRPENAVENRHAWLARLVRDHEEEVADYDRHLPKVPCWNSPGRHDSWERTGHTVASPIEAARRHAAPHLLSQSFDIDAPNYFCRQNGYDSS